MFSVVNNLRKKCVSYFLLPEEAMDAVLTSTAGTIISEIIVCSLLATLKSYPDGFLWSCNGVNVSFFVNGETFLFLFKVRITKPIRFMVCDLEI